MSGSWGHEAKRSSISLTFDHLGEAAELEFGSLRDDEPVGHHRSVDEILPAVLAFLERLGARATFFVEAWNATVYPDALRGIVDAGHELSCHSYRHEDWQQVGLDDMAELLKRCVEAYATCGLTVSGIRPPGGFAADGCADVLRGHGFQYVSLADDRTGVAHGIAHLPYQWRTVDGVYYLGQFAHLRQPPGVGSASAEETIAALDRVRQENVRDGGHVSFDFHVPMLDSDARLAVLQQVTQRIQADDDVWFAPCGEVAAWMLERPAEYPYEHPGERLAAWTAAQVRQAHSHGGAG